jgi:hypothetical protein
LHVTKISMNILSTYQIAQSSIGKRVEFTSDFVTIYYIHNNSKIVVGEVNNHSQLYTFSNFIAKSNSLFLLTDSNDDSRFGHEIFGDIN